tara:strand:+ start:714 stop:851 length:138 start_codon:yes stop_codon:yes gene_type:complete
MSNTTISRKPKDKATADSLRLVEKIINKLELRIVALEKWKKEQGG